MTQERPHLLQLPFAADERRRSRPHRRDVQLRILREDRAFELPQRRSRLDPERLDERLPRRPEGRQGLGLPARAVEGEHEPAEQVLRQWVLGDQALELADELAVAAESEISVDAILERGEVKLPKPTDLVLRPRLVRELDERRAAPEREGFAQALGSGPRLCSTRLGHEVLEAVQIETAGRDAQLVARRPGDDRVAAERLAELRDVRLQDLRRGGRWTTGPESLDQPVAPHGLIRMQEQNREESAWLRRIGCDDATSGYRFERPENAELHCGLRSERNTLPPMRPGARYTGAAPPLERQRRALPWHEATERSRVLSR